MKSRLIGLLCDADAQNDDGIAGTWKYKVTGTSAVHFLECKYKDEKGSDSGNCKIWWKNL